jgi:hypothetical protein
MEDGAAVGRVLDVVIKLDGPDPRIARIRRGGPGVPSRRR